jgi:hypothetical protein
MIKLGYKFEKPFKISIFNKSLKVDVLSQADTPQENMKQPEFFCFPYWAVSLSTLRSY